MNSRRLFLRDEAFAFLLRGNGEDGNGAEDHDEACRNVIGSAGGGLLSLSLAAPPLAIVILLRGRSLLRQADARSRAVLRLAVCPQSPTSIHAAESVVQDVEPGPPPMYLVVDEDLPGCVVDPFDGDRHEAHR